jgi:coenzyme F420-reducing hydrogenase beta subunit
MYQNTMYTEFLLAKSGLSPSEVSRIAYRQKSANEPVANYAFRAYDKTGKAGKAVHYRGSPSRLGRHGHFRLNACNYCMDVFAEASDATFMDAWLPEFADDTKGSSLVVVRSPLVMGLLRAGKNEGVLHVEEVPSSYAIRSQTTHIHRKQELIRMRVPKAPDRKGNRPPSFLERIDWLLQRETQRLSRRAWNLVGRTYGPVAYWLITLPLTSTAFAITCLSRIAAFATTVRCKIARSQSPNQ